MEIVSFPFVILFVSTFILYYIIAPTFRNRLLLLASAIFIGYFHISFLITALFISLAVFFIAQKLEKIQDEKKAQLFFAAGICCLVACWMFFRHAVWLTDIINGIGLPANGVSQSIIFPLGISFYTFQAIAYLTEVYWKEQKAERDVCAFLLYMLFFMKFLSGPIERPDLLSQLKNDRIFDYKCVTSGAKLVMIGLIKKLILANSLSPHTENIFNSIHDSSGIQLLVACVLYPIELYADFSGYTDCAIGGAMMLGIKLSPNFDRPFISQSTSELWRRWHISLSFWVRDYLYMPMSSYTRRMGEWGIYLSLLVTFVALGVWHGTGWGFVVYGLIQGVLIVWEMKTAVLRNQLKRALGPLLYGAIFGIRTYILFALSLIFFNMHSLADAIYYISHLSFYHNHSWREVNIGIPDHDLIVAGITLALILAYEYFSSKRDLIKSFDELPAYLRWSAYYLLLLALFTLGKFGTDNFIYLQF